MSSGELLLQPDQVFVILGKTQRGSTFRPSDWSQRLAGVMSQFGPLGAACRSPYCYSPWCSPSHIDGVSCVVLSRHLQEHFPQAWDFCMSFARDNELKTQIFPASFQAVEAQMHPQKKQSPAMGAA